MGTNMSNYPNGFNYGALVREAMVANPPRRNLYVGNNGTAVSGEITKADNAGYGTFLKPYSTLDYAVGQSKAGDYIWVRPGHTETISAAGSLTLDVAGITVVFLGNGTNKANCTFTATGADIDVTAAGVTLIAPRFVTGIDAVAAGVHVAAADFHMYGVEVHDAAAMAMTIQVLTTSAANRMVIDGYKFFASTTGTQKTDGIKLVGGSGISLRNVEITGDFSTSPVNVSTTTLLNQWENMYLNNTNSGPQPAMTIGANATGFAKNVKARVASGTSYTSSVAKIQWGADCEGFSTDGYTGEPLGTVLSTGVEGKIDVIDGYFDVPTADATTNTTIRDVVGIKTDAAVNAVGTTKTIIAYAKGIVNEITVPTADSTDNGFINDIIGNKADAAVYALAANKSLVAYLKGLLATAPRTAQSAAAAALTNAATLFTIAGGPIAIEYLISICIATGDGGAATLQYNSAPTVGSAATISGATGSLATAVAGSMVVFIGTALATAPTFLTTGHGVASTGPSKIVVNEGTITSTVGGAASTATWKHYLRYTPLATGVTVA